MLLQSPKEMLDISIFSDSLGQMQIIYCNFIQTDPSQDDHEHEECLPGVFFKETEVLMDFFPLKPTHILPF